MAWEDENLDRNGLPCMKVSVNQIEACKTQKATKLHRLLDQMHVRTGHDHGTVRHNSDPTSALIRLEVKT